jgi:general secretion pathway protein F
VTQFEYQAVDETGEHINGTIAATDRREAVASLTQKGHFVTSLALKKNEPTERKEDTAAAKKNRRFNLVRGRVNSKDILAITGQLSAALRAGLPLLNCLRVVQKQVQKPAVKDMLGRLTHLVSTGSSLSEAMEQQGDTFNTLYLAMIRVGETGGIIEDTTSQLTSLLRREEQVKSNIKTASMYPLIVLMVGFISVIIIITWILPRIIRSIGEGTLLPWPTRVLMGISGFISGYGWLVLVGAILGVLLFRKWLRTTSGRLVWDGFKLKIPVMGRVQKTIAVGRFTRTLGSLTKGGVTILEALQVVRDTLGNELLGREIDNVAHDVKSGAPLAEPMEASGYFPPLLVQIISVGEQTGKLDELLLNAADTFDSEADTAIERFMALLPALLVLLLAVVIGFIVAGALLPIVAMQLGAGGV